MIGSGSTGCRSSWSQARQPHSWPGAGDEGSDTAYAAGVSADRLPARVEDVHELAVGMPHVTVEHGPGGNPVYQVGGKSFVFFRTPRPDATDPETGKRLSDVIVFWVISEAEKQALVQDPGRPSSRRHTSTVTTRSCCGPAGSASSHVRS